MFQKVVLIENIENKLPSKAYDNFPKCPKKPVQPQINHNHNNHINNNIKKHNH